MGMTRLPLSLFPAPTNLEPLTKPAFYISVLHRAVAPEAETNDTHGERVPSLLDVQQPVPTDTHSPQSFEPGIGSLDNPPYSPQSGTMLGPTFGNLWFDSQPPQQSASCFTV